LKNLLKTQINRERFFYQHQNKPEKMEKLTEMSKEMTTGKLHEPKNGKSMIIAGPCSAESPGQMLDTANALMLTGKVDYFRAGLWKPRTSPESFQGVGAEGLKWLKMVREETGMKVATEVGCEKHVLEALKYDIDLLWIGARTVSNPFVVQEIAESLRGVDIPVLVKNPLNPDPELWYGAITRFLKVGIREVGAIHRGFSVWGESIYRNPPFWKIPNDLTKRMPGILMVCDPSHIAGKRSLVPLVSRRAMEEGAGGLMIEVHPDPANAMSDSAQQLTPDSFSVMMEDIDPDRLQDKSNEVSSVIEDLTPGLHHYKAGEDSSVDELSLEIDMVDEMLVHAIASRMELSRQIARKRNSDGIGSPATVRLEKALKRILGIASEDGLRPGFVHKLFNEIHKESSQIRSSCSGVIDK
jgi:chorismate mutase